MHWLLTPYDRHSDDGFGAMATEFKASAETLLAAKKDSAIHRELPACFLLRHAAELFLKSALVVSHRAFTEQGEHYPSVLVGTKSRPMTNVHGVGPLYDALVGVLTQHRTELQRRAPTPWLPMPDELEKAIRAIDGMDVSGVFFRYPTDSNAIKSANKAITPDELASWNKDERGYLKAFVVVDRNNSLVEAFHHAPEPLAFELAELQRACYWLECIHVGLRMELAGGW